MKKEFVPEEETKELYDLGLKHKKGFEALACYYGGGLVKLVTTHGLPAPTYSQAFRWFREKYSLDHVITRLPKGYRAFIDTENGVSELWRDTFNTYEEAQLECLRKLIEIVKERK